MPMTIDCRQVDEHLDRLLAEPAAGLPDAVRTHVEQCPRCERLYHWMTGPAPVEPGADRLAQTLRDRVAADLKPVKPLPSTPVLVLRFLVVMLAIEVLFVRWRGPGALADLSVLQLVVVVLTFGAAAVLLAVSLSCQMVPATRQRLPVPALLAGVAALFALVVLLLFPWGDPHSDDLTSACTWFGLGVAAPTALITTLLARRGAPLDYARLGASVGAASGLLGVMVLQIHCTRLQASHYVIWHGLVLLVSLCVGAAAGAAARGLTRLSHA